MEKEEIKKKLRKEIESFPKEVRGITISSISKKYRIPYDFAFEIAREIETPLNELKVKEYTLCPACLSTLMEEVCLNCGEETELGGDPIYHELEIRKTKDKKGSV